MPSPSGRSRPCSSRSSITRSAVRCSGNERHVVRWGSVWCVAGARGVERGTSHNWENMHGHACRQATAATQGATQGNRAALTRGQAHQGSNTRPPSNTWWFHRCTWSSRWRSRRSCPCQHAKQPPLTRVTKRLELSCDAGLPLRLLPLPLLPPPLPLAGLLRRGAWGRKGDLGTLLPLPLLLPSKPLRMHPCCRLCRRLRRCRAPAGQQPPQAPRPPCDGRPPRRPPPPPSGARHTANLPPPPPLPRCAPWHPQSRPAPPRACGAVVCRAGGRGLQDGAAAGAAGRRAAGGAGVPTAACHNPPRSLGPSHSGLPGPPQLPPSTAASPPCQHNPAGCSTHRAVIWASSRAASSFPFLPSFFTWSFSAFCSCTRQGSQVEQA